MLHSINIHTVEEIFLCQPEDYKMYLLYSNLKWKLTLSFISPQSLESTRRMLQLVEEVRKKHKTLILLIKSVTQ